jgi:8-oxo-dGTP pyrophosphatase MutT (NUDIX family)
MKIFLNDKTIELLESQPGKILPEEQVVEYASGKQLKKIFRSFEEDDQLTKLVIWPDKKDGSLQQDFFQLFKRVDAAGGLVKNERGEMLFIFRLGKWDLPKGKLAGTETPEEGAIREVMEETGLSGLTVKDALPSTWHIYSRKGKQILKQTFWFEMEASSKQTLIPQTTEDITEVRWIVPAVIQEVLLNTYSSIRELVLSFKN